MELGAQDVTSRRQFAALERLSTLVTQERDGEKRVRAILLGSPKGAQLAAMPPEWMQQRSWQAAAAQALKQLRTVNDSQRAAIAAGLVRSLTLWQGPPGTGKTRTILEFLALLCGMAGASNERRQQIGVALAVADTNAAADNLLEGLLARGLSVTRVGQPAKVRPELRHTCLDAMAENTPAGKSAAALRDQAATLLVRSEDAIRSGRLSPQEAAQVQRDAQRMWAQADKILAEAAGGVLQRCQVVVCTCAAAGEARLAEVAFRVVVVDEATQATEPSTLIALVKGAECVIMAGDHKQLPPTVISRKAVELGMDVPLFARLQRGGVPALLLNRQYRMHPAIAAFPSAQFYEGKVLSGVAAHERPALCGFQWKAPSLPVAFVHCSGPEDRARSGALSSIQDDSGSSYSNKAQAEIVVDVAAGFLKDPTVTSCVILTPYNGQVRLLNTLCKPRFGQLLESGKLIISTVDGFQGREGDAVVFSTVRCNPDAKLGFVADARRMNVALTRARRGVVVVGCGHTLGSGSQHWREWLSWLGGQQTTHVE